MDMYTRRLFYIVVSYLIIQNVSYATISQQCPQKGDSCNQEGHRVVCLTSNVTDTLSGLQARSIESLTLILCPGEHLLESEPFENFTNLHALEIEPYAPRNFGDYSLDCEPAARYSLGNVEYLRINIQMIGNGYWQCDGLIEPLQSIKTLDLSRTINLGFTIIQSAINSLDQTLLQNLIIRNIQTEDRFGFSLSLGNTFCTLKDTPLRVLDLSYNGIRHVSAQTLDKCLPHLRELYLNNNLLTNVFASNGIVYILTNLNLEVVDLGCQWCTNKDNDSRIWETIVPEIKTQSSNTTLNSTTVLPVWKEQYQLYFPPYGFNMSLVNTILSKLLNCDYDGHMNSCISDFSNRFPNRIHIYPYSLCELLGCMWGETLIIQSCIQLLPVIMGSYIVQEKCYNKCILGLNFPIGQNLKRIIFNEYGTYHPTSNIKSMFLQLNNFCLQENDIEYLDYSGYSHFPSELRENFNSFNFQQFGKLKTLNLRNNGMNLWNFKLFHLSINLETLIISGNTLNVHNDTNLELFQKTVKLVKLDLSNCGIHNIPESYFNYLFDLRDLDLSSNKIDASFKINLRNNTSLHSLNLRNNLIFMLSEYMQEQLAAHPGLTLDLRDNPLSCTCTDIPFLEWFQNNKHNINFKEPETYLCTTQSNLKIKLLSVNIGTLKWECSKIWIVLAVIGGTLLSCLVLIVIPFIIYRRRWRLRHWCFTVQEKLSKRSQDEQNTDLPYDLFVLYSHVDRFWVHDVLLKELEDIYGFKLCIHFRDFLIGVDILDNVEDAIKKSRKVLAVISPNFVQSDWCVDELQMTRSYDQNKIVLMILEELPLSMRLPPVLQLLLETKTYVEWSNHSEGKTLFWKKLVKYIYAKPARNLKTINENSTSL